MTTDTIYYTVTTDDGINTSSTTYSATWDSNSPNQSHLNLVCYMTVKDKNNNDLGPADLYMDANGLPIDTIAIEFSSSPPAEVKFVIACEAVHGHYKPENPSADPTYDSTCAIANNTVTTDKKFEVHVTPTSAMYSTYEATWDFPYVSAFVQPKRLTIKVKRAS